MPEHPHQPEMPGNASPLNFLEQFSFAAASSITFDADEFLQFLDGEDWTIYQKRAYVQALWPVVVALLDWNFRFDPVQEALAVAKQLERDAPK